MRKIIIVFILFLNFTKWTKLSYLKIQIFVFLNNIILYAFMLFNHQWQQMTYDVVVPIGFNFDFYGGTYSSCVVSGNGYITFDTTVANTGSPWSINVAIPNPGQMPENAIMGHGKI